MGNSSSRKSKRQKEAPNANTSATTETSTRPPQVALEPKDIMVCFSSSDSEFVRFLKDSFEKSGISVWADFPAEKAPPGVAGKAVVATSVFVFVVSEESACSNFCEDAVSFAYISNTPIIPVALQQQDTLEVFLNAGLRLTLGDMKWFIFDEKSKYKEALPSLVSTIREDIDQVKEEELRPKQDNQGLRSTPVGFNTSIATRVDVHVERASVANGTSATVGKGGPAQTQTFWDRSFGDQQQVPWFRFQEAFLEEYKANLKHMFNDDSTQWLLKLLEREVFEGHDHVTREQFMKFRGDSPQKHQFWKKVSRLAIESYNMHQVFDMESSVRLAAVENLSKFSSKAVIEALMNLLDDPDANIRAVAAISLARTEVSNDRIVNKLIASLKDGDRLVRESGCLALGHMKAVKAVPAVVARWRNDAISHVRAAAEVALSNIGGEEAEKAVHMTKVLTSEMKELSQTKSV